MLDLRSDAEVDDAGAFPHDRLPVRWEHLTSPFGPPGSGGASPRQQEMLDHPDPMALLYVEMMREMAAEFARAVRILANPANLPAVFHCTSGKDRTGLLAAIVQLLVGVPLPIVLADYERSSQWETQIRSDMLDRYPSLAELPADKVSRMASCNRRWLVSALAIAADHGGLDGWLDHHGCPVHLQVRLRSTLIELPVV